MGIADANKGNVLLASNGNPGIAVSIGGDRHVGDVVEAISAHVDPVVIAPAKIVDVVVSVGVREDEGIGAGHHGTDRRRG